MRKDKHSLSIESGLFAYLELRAKRNRRSPTSELNVLLAEIREADRLPETQQKAQQEQGTQLIIPVVRPPPINLPTGYLGVRFTTSGWAAEIQIDDQRHGLGIYSTPEEAAHAYDIYVRQLPGQHQTNFPMEGPNDPQPNNPQLDQQLNRLNPLPYQPVDEIGFPCPVCGSYGRCDCMPDGPGSFPAPGLKVFPGGIRVTPSNKPPRNFTEDFRKKVEPVNEPDGEGSVDD